MIPSVVVAGGARREVLRSSDDLSRALVFLHEGLGSAAQWRDLPEALAASTGWAAVAYSRRGYGRSAALAAPFTPAFMHEAARVELPVLLDALGVRNAVLVGHSDGGSIALIAAADAGGSCTIGRTRLHAVVALAPHVLVEDRTTASIAALRAQADAGWRVRFARHHDHPDALFQAWTDVWLSPEFRSWSIVGDLSRIAVPLTVVAGDDDPYGSRQQMDEIARALPSAVIDWVPGCGHAPQKDARERVEVAVRRTAAAERLEDRGSGRTC